MYVILAEHFTCQLHMKQNTHCFSLIKKKKYTLLFISLMHGNSWMGNGNLLKIENRKAKGQGTTII
jgi:hypothetical protein